MSLFQVCVISWPVICVFLNVSKSFKYLKVQLNLLLFSNDIEFWIRLKIFGVNLTTSRYVQLAILHFNFKK